jgi:hypothetical protein
MGPEKHDLTHARFHTRLDLGVAAWGAICLRREDITKTTILDESKKFSAMV